MPFMLVLAYFTLQRGKRCGLTEKSTRPGQVASPGPLSLPGLEDWLKGRAAAGPRGPAEGGSVFRKSGQCPLPLNPGWSSTQCACAVVSTWCKEGGVAIVTGILYRVMLAEGRAQQGCCFLALRGQGNV